MLHLGLVVDAHSAQKYEPKLLVVRSPLFSGTMSYISQYTIGSVTVSLLCNKLLGYGKWRQMGMLHWCNILTYTTLTNVNTFSDPVYPLGCAVHAKEYIA